MKVNFSGVQLRSCNHADRSDKVIDAMTVFGFLDPKNGRKVGFTPGTLTYKYSPHPPLRGPPSPQGKARQGSCQPTDKPKFEHVNEASERNGK